MTAVCILYISLKLIPALPRENGDLIQSEINIVGRSHQFIIMYYWRDWITVRVMSI